MEYIVGVVLFVKVINFVVVDFEIRFDMMVVVKELFMKRLSEIEGVVVNMF